MNTEFDKGPPNHIAEIFARMPDHSEYQEHYWYNWGPIFYRGRLDGSAKLLVVASDAGPTERLVGRNLVGDAGQRVQGFLAKLGLSRSYLCLNAHPLSLHPSHFFAGLKILEDPEISSWRNEVFEATTSDKLQAVICFGAQAQKAVDLWEDRPNVPVIEVPHPSSRDAEKMATAWRDAVLELRRVISPDEIAGHEIPNYRTLVTQSDYAAIPKADLPFGLPSWMGDDPVGSNPNFRKSSVKRKGDHVIIWDSTGRELTGPKLDDNNRRVQRFALNGKIVTMNANREVIEDGIIYVEGERIVAVQSADLPAPTGFSGVEVIKTGGTIYPGMIELHNHLSYNILPLWELDRSFEHRGQWSSHDQYRKFVTKPMQVVASNEARTKAIVRYVEMKCLLSGVTTSQGITLSSAGGMQKFYRGIVRNVEQTHSSDLPEASTKISDVAANDARRFHQDLLDDSCKLLHLSEGIGPKARKHFLALNYDGDQWAIERSLTGIHAAGLEGEDFARFAAKGASIVWSPLSNYLLYGDTAKIAEAKNEGVNITLGSDWSASGSKNLLGELKIAKLISDHHNSLFTDQELFEMVTTAPARALQWDQHLGSIEAGKFADLIVLNGRAGNPYERILNARETSIILTLINGVARAGQARLMGALAQFTEDVDLGSSSRQVNLKDEHAAEFLGDLKLGEAATMLNDAMRNLVSLAEELDAAIPVGSSDRLHDNAIADQGWVLHLNHEDHRHEFSRLNVIESEPNMIPIGAPKKLAEIVQPMKLDRLTIADDASYYSRLASNPNLPAFLRAGLKALA